MQRVSEFLPEVSTDESSQQSSIFALSQDSSVLSGGHVLQDLEVHLQAAYRWASVAFEEPRRNDQQMIQHALQKCCSGLLQAVGRLGLSDECMSEMLQRILPTASAAIAEWNAPVSREGVVIVEEDNDETCQGDTDMGGEERSSVDASVPSDDHEHTLASFDDLRQYLISNSELPKFDQISSLDEPKRILKECVIYPSKFPHFFQGVRQPWKGILLYGPPGTGKTELAKAVAGECGAAFILLTPSALLSKFMGESEKLMSRIFSFAKFVAQQQQAAVIFFDEIDALAISRGSESSDQGLRRLLAELLLQFNALKPAHRVVVLGATNRIDDIDSALIRRFERRIEVGLLPQNERADLMSLKMAGTEMDATVDLQEIARFTDGFSGAELELLCREAAMHGVRELMEAMDDNSLSTSPSVRPVTQRDFVEALPAIKPTCTASCASTPEKDDDARRRKVARVTSSSVITIKKESEA